MASVSSRDRLLARNDMRSFFYRVLEWIRLLFGVMPRSGFGSAKIFLVIHYCFIAIVTIVLAIPPVSDWVREVLGFEQRFRHLPYQWMDDSWCGIAFLILYLIIRIVLYLMELLGIEDESDFPDIDSDWAEILDALEKERLPIDDIPLFLVNGFTPQQEQSAFEGASGIDWKVVAPPLTQKSAVVRVFANDDAIFLCCTGVGATNCQQGKVDTSVPSNSAPSAPSGFSGTQQPGQLQGVLEKARAGTKTNPPGGLQPASPAPPSAAPAAPSKPVGGFFGTIAPGGLKRAMETFAALRNADNKGYGKKKLAPLNDVEMMLGLCRIEYLCSLIIEARRPYCPINGILQAVPFSWAEDVDYAKRLVPSIREDIIALHERLQLQFPVVAVVTELDDVAGMREFILRAERLQPGLRLSRAGSSFAAGASVSDRHAGWLIERALQWFRGWVYSSFAYDMDNKDNQRLFNMLCSINQRRSGLITLLRDSFYKVLTPEVRLHGCYFCATGRASTEQGFIRGVLDKLPESQGEVAWTPQLEQSQKRSKFLGWGFIVGTVVLVAATAMILLDLGGS
ncbi:MAG TPA: hypothetical protein DCG12_01660 [Planctomycetaceae bacterium]|nr:hypothetical protein [Planctomycetaceae bacterium]